MHCSLQSVGLSIALLIAWSPNALSCSCGSPTLEWRFENSANVFTAITGDGYEDYFEQPRSVRTPVSVTRTFKGSVPFDTVVSEIGGSTCGTWLETGVEYLFFASDEGHIGSCSGIRKTAEAAPEIAAIQAFLAGESSSITEPWRFSEEESSCTLQTGFLKEEAPYIRGYVQIGAVRQGIETPDIARGRFTVNVRLQSSFTGRPDDLSPGVLHLRVNDVSQEAIWLGFDVSIEMPDGSSRILQIPPSFLIFDEKAEAIVGELGKANALQVRLEGHAIETSFDVSLSTVAMEDSFAQFLECAGF